MQALAAEHPNFQFGIAATIFATNLEDAQEHPRRGPAPRSSTSSSTCCGSPTTCSDNKEPRRRRSASSEREEEFMRQFFLERVQEESVLSGQAFMYLHYADMIANGYKRTMPCPFRTQGLLLNPDGDAATTARTRSRSATCSTPRRGRCTSRPRTSPHRDDVRGDHLPDLPEPVPGERRRDEAVRAVREVPRAGLPGEARPRRATSRRFPATR